MLMATASISTVSTTLELDQTGELWGVASSSVIEEPQRVEPWGLLKLQ